MIVTLPAPPSTNAIWRAFRGRVIKSREYRAWLEQAALEIMRQRPKPVCGPVFLSIVCEENGRRDLDGYAKAIIDCLVTNKLIDGDRCKTVRRILMDWAEGVTGVSVMVAPWGAK